HSRLIGRGCLDCDLSVVSSLTLDIRLAASVGRGSNAAGRGMGRAEGFEPPTPRIRVWVMRTPPDLTGRPCLFRMPGLYGFCVPPRSVAFRCSQRFCVPDVSPAPEARPPDFSAKGTAVRQILTDALCRTRPPRTGRLEIADLRQAGLVLRI